MKKLTLMIIATVFMMVGCATPTQSTPEDTRLIRLAQAQKFYDMPDAYSVDFKKYDCFLQAYVERGEAVLPQPLPSQTDGSGKREYNVVTPSGKVIPVRVYSTGEVSYAPGEAFAEMLEESGLLDSVTINDYYTVTDLTEIEWIVFEGDKITPHEAKRINDVYALEYNLLGTPDEKLNIFQLLNDPMHGATYEESLANFETYKSLQMKHKPEIMQSWMTNLQQGKERASVFTGNPLCDNYAEALWEKKIDAVQVIQDSDEAPVVLQGTYWRYVRPGWKPGQWGMLILIALDREFAYNGADLAYMSEGDRVSYFYTDPNGQEKPFTYSFTRIGEGPLLDHEIAHFVVLADETAADLGGYALRKVQHLRWQSGDFRAPFVAIDAHTGEPLPPPLVP